MCRSLIIILLSGVILLSAACNLEQAPPPPLDLPNVQFIEPANNTRIVEGGTLPIDVYASDDAGEVVGVIVLLDGIVLIEAETPNYQPLAEFRIETDWIAQGLGFHTLSARAIRVDGTPSDEQFISVEVVTE